MHPKRLGVATATDLADYFRLKMKDARPRLAELVEDKTLEVLVVEGWHQPAYLNPGVSAPRRTDACTLLSPFDPLVWRRERAERLFDFEYTIEIYVPARKRKYGYYVLPFLMGDQIGRAGGSQERAQRGRALCAWRLGRGTRWRAGCSVQGAGRTGAARRTRVLVGLVGARRRAQAWTPRFFDFRAGPLLEFRGPRRHRW